MKIRIQIAALVILFAVSSFAQVKLSVEQENVDSSINQNGYAVDARPYLEKFYKIVGFDPATAQAPVNLRKTAWNFQVGTTKSWWAVDFKDNKYVSVPSTCRHVGQNSYIFVQDAIWNQSVTQSGVDAVAEAFNVKTPLNNGKGIYQNNIDAFGFPPDVDNDPKIVILILDIVDTYDGPGSGYVAGYFSSANQASGLNSNMAEIYYLDGAQSNLTTTGGLQTAMSTTAHEFQHMIHYNYIKNQTTFFNEAFSLVAEVINGYPIYGQSRFANEPNQYLLNWRGSGDPDVLTDYSRAARFAQYLKEQFGNGLFKNVLEGKISGVNGLNLALNKNIPATTRQFNDIIVDWFLANQINNKNVDARFGYDYPNLPKMLTKTHVNPNVTNNYETGVYKYGVQYISYTSGSNLKINFNTFGNNAIEVKAIKIGATTEVVNVPINTQYSFPDFGTTYKTVTFCVFHRDGNEFSQGPFQYSYTSTGTFQTQALEVKWDTSEPTGYLQLTPGDSVGVHFEGVSGGKLDSIKVAVRGVQPLDGGVFDYVGLSNKFGGKKLASFTVNSTLSAPPAVVNSGADYPYEIPYKNWVKVDLRSFNIDASNPFAVAFPVGAAYPTTNRVMSTYYQSTSSYHSFSYKSNDATPRWLYYSVSGKDGFIFLFLVRAYISFGTTDVNEVVELLPSQFSLEQNYPNPFNPSTIISYNLPKSSNVQIKIFDALGREIRSLINEEKVAGKYNIAWDSRDNYGQKVSSGIYFYSIVAGDFVESKKMVLMK